MSDTLAPTGPEDLNRQLGPAARNKPGNPSGPASANNDRVEIPAQWRTIQIVFLVAIGLLAAYYDTVGWRNPPGAGGTVTQTRSISDQIGFLVLAALVWFTTPSSWVIAVTTFHESWRRRWMTGLLIFTVVMLICMGLFTWMQPGEEEFFLRDFGTGFIILMTMLMTIFLSVGLIPPEVDRRIILTILAKPVTRVEYLTGKFLGLALTLLVNLLVMGSVYLVSYVAFVVHHDPGGFAGAMVSNPTAQHMGLHFTLRNLVHALVLDYGQMMVMAALGLMMSLMVSQVTALVFSFIAYFGGQMSSYWGQMGSGSNTASQNAPGLSKGMQGVVSAVYLLMPRLDHYDVRTQLVNDTAVGFNAVWKAWNAGLVYMAVILTIGYLVFSEREF